MKKITLKPRQVGVGGFKATPRMYELIHEVLDSGIIGYGPKSMEFERKFAAMHGCKYAILSNSGTSSLQVSLQALMETHGWLHGSKVIVPATTFISTANIVRHNRLIPTFVDVRADTFNIDENLIEAAITDETKAIIPVHLFGQPANMQAIMEIARKHNLVIIEDSCECMFVSHWGQPVGSLGDIGCFSTYVAHLITTGVGGISTTNNPDYAAKVRSLVNHGLELRFLSPDENFAPRPTPGRRFKFDMLGHSFRITEMEAAIGLAQLEEADQILAIRRRNARHMQAGIDLINKHYDEPFVTQKPIEGTANSFMMFPLLLNDTKHKEPLMAWLNERGVETRDMMPILGQPIYNWLHPDDFPVSKWIVEGGLYTGCHQLLDPEDIQYVLTCITEYFDKVKLER